MLAECCSYKFTIAYFAIVALIAVPNVVDAQSSCTTLRREAGVCVPILKCETITTLLNRAPRPLPPSIAQLVQRSHCGTFNDQHHVCCEINSVSNGEGTSTHTEPPTTTARSSTDNRVSTDGSSSKIRPSVEKSSSDAQAGMRILEGTRCGISNGDRVANGEDANLSEYPWMALLIYDDGLGSRTLDCGGSLITSRYVLTAAHCIRTGNKRLVSVRLGEHDTKQTIDCVTISRKRKCAPAVQEIDIEEAIYHKDYNPSQFSNDIGLVRLSRPANFETHIQPVCLPITPSSMSVTLRRMIISGWGRIENGLKASILQKASVPIVDNDSCQKIHRVIRITEKQLCAGGENEIDTCKGDSGGPIFFSGRYRKGARYIQYGVVSAGSSLCGSNYPGIYVRVTAYLPWIAGNIST